MAEAPKTHAPLISAVICTFNRDELLAKALGALCGQTLPRSDFEVVVIDDGSTDNTRQITESFQSLLNLRYVYQANAGLASGKNHGLFLARAPVVIFMDDDDVADADMLAQHVATHAQHPGVEYAVLGYTGLADEVAKSPMMRYVTEVGCHLFSYPSLEHGAELDFSYFWGGRSSCKKAFLLEHGVFNPVFQFGAEDIELGYRLSAYGLKVVYNKHAISTMIRTLDFDGFCNRSYRQGRSNKVFSELHPSDQVRAWTQIDGVDDDWNVIAPRYAAMLQRARKLEQLVEARYAHDLSVDRALLTLLHRSYQLAFEASRIRGSAGCESAR